MKSLNSDVEQTPQATAKMKKQNALRSKSSCTMVMEMNEQNSVPVNTPYTNNFIPLQSVVVILTVVTCSSTSIYTNIIIPHISSWQPTQI